MSFLFAVLSKLSPKLEEWYHLLDQQVLDALMTFMYM